MTTSADRVVPLSLGVLPVTDVPWPILLQNEHEAYLLFDAWPEATSAPRGLACVHVRNCLIARLGHPNDEALPGHPLYQHGLRPYGTFEVQESSWLAQLQTQNRRCFPNFKMPERRHVVISFHDSTFECIAGSLQATLEHDDLAQVLIRVTQSLREPD